MQRRLFELKAVSNESCDQLDDKVERAAMARMLDLRDVLELVVDSLHDGALTQ